MGRTARVRSELLGVGEIAADAQFACVYFRGFFVAETAAGTAAGFSRSLPR